MAVRSSRLAEKPTISDLLDGDARVIVIESFRPRMSRIYAKGEFHRLDDPIVRAFPAYFAVVVPVESLDVIER